MEQHLGILLIGDSHTTLTRALALSAENPVAVLDADLVGWEEVAKTSMTTRSRGVNLVVLSSTDAPEHIVTNMGSVEDLRRA